MNNDAKFVALAHNLLLKIGIVGEDQQVHKNKAANIQALIQATKKKHFKSLDLERSQILNAAIHNTTPSSQDL
jgi:hypothetical protein